MTNTPTFKSGDRVRLTGHLWDGLWVEDGRTPPPAGEVTISRVDDGYGIAFFNHDSEEWYIGQYGYEAEPVGSTCDRHIAHIADLDAVIRRHQATIERQNKLLTEYAKQLEDSTHTLDKTAYQLGLDSDQAVSALEVGARLFALGLDPSEAGSATMRFLGPESDELDAMLREFHEAFGLERNIYFDCYDIDPDLIKRQHFLQEEVNELLEAILKGDRVAAADALGDIIYIAAGTADLAGIPIMKVLRVIHAANMRKLGPDGKPVPHATIPGKIGKPEGWTGPEADIKRILEEA